MSFDLILLKLKKVTSKKGFTLIELLICIVVFSIVLVITTQSIILITRKAGIAKLRAETNENARFTIELIKRELRETSNKQNRRLECGTSTGRSVCIFTNSSDTKIIKICRTDSGDIIRGEYNFGSSVDSSCVEAANFKKINNNSIMYVRSLVFTANANNKYFDITMDYTDTRGALCPIEGINGKCNTLSSGIVIRNQ